jgi:hypothetical protein
VFDGRTLVKEKVLTPAKASAALSQWLSKGFSALPVASFDQ